MPHTYGRAHAIKILFAPKKGRTSWEEAHMYAVAFVRVPDDAPRYGARQVQRRLTDDDNGHRICVTRRWGRLNSELWRGLSEPAALWDLCSTLEGAPGWMCSSNGL